MVLSLMNAEAVQAWHEPDVLCYSSAPGLCLP
jgi:hypothetical protein